MMGPPAIATVTKSVFPVVEIFGPTIQGEGDMAGLPSHFIRFGGCDFACHWCDSAHAVLAENVRKVPKLTVTEIMEDVLNLDAEGGTTGWVTLSGGNPALHELGKLVDQLHKNGYKVAVETQGSRWKSWLLMVDTLTVSPKPPSSKMVNLFLPTFIDAYQESVMNSRLGVPKLVLKVPVYDEEDLDFAADIHSQYPKYPFFVSVVTEMGGLYGDFGGGRVDTAGSLLARYQRVAQDVLRRPELSDVRVIPQLHYLIWGNKVGV